MTAPETMIERCARAIAADLGKQDNGEPYLLGPELTLPYLDQSEVDVGALAHAVLSALREPSEGMLVAGADVLICEGHFKPDGARTVTCNRKHWIAMIDFALAEKG